jgi:hypothetical protein
LGSGRFRALGVSVAKGGARARSGPPPDPNALRRDRPSDGEWKSLPAEGRKGRAPGWPFAEQSSREKQLWSREWKRPQAVEWERNGQELEVALYVRCLADAESPRASVAARTLVRQQQEALGLSLPGLARNRWRIADVEPEPVVQLASGSSRDRFRVVDGGAA